MGKCLTIPHRKCFASVLICRAVSISPEGRPSSSPLMAQPAAPPPTAYHAATLNHPGSWAPAPLPRKRTCFLLPSPPLSSLARMSSARPDILCQDVTPVLLLPSFLPLDVKKSKLDHQEVPSTPPGLACIPRNVVLGAHYGPVLLLPRNPSCTTDVLWDNHSSLNRNISSYSIQFDNDTEPEKLSHSVSNFKNAFSQHQEACSQLALTDLPIQDVVLALVKKCKDIPSHSAHVNRGKAMAMPLEVIPTRTNLVKQLQSAFVKQDLCLSCKSLELPPQSSVKAESFLIHVAMKFDFPRPNQRWPFLPEAWPRTLMAKPMSSIHKTISVSYCNFTALSRLIPYAQSQEGGCKGCDSLWSYYWVIPLAIFTYRLWAATYVPFLAFFLLNLWFLPLCCIFDLLILWLIYADRALCLGFRPSWGRFLTLPLIDWVQLPKKTLY